MINENQLFGSLTITDVDRVAREAGLSLLDLLIPDSGDRELQPEPDEMPNADQRVLNQLLRAKNVRQNETVLAVALG